MKIVVSAGHCEAVGGATGFLNEFEENVRVAKKVNELLADSGVTSWLFVDRTSKTQKENLQRIVEFHNNKKRDLDVSIHFNSYKSTSKPMGTECLYLTQESLATSVSAAVSQVSKLKNRGPKKHTDLYFLNETEEPAIIVEVCFVDSSVDANLYRLHFDTICLAIALTISGATEGTFNAIGKASTFGGPDDTGVSPSEGLAFISKIEQAPHLFLPYQPNGTSGLARRLNPYVHYIACRWDYSSTPKDQLLQSRAIVRAIETGVVLKAFPADWGPNENTGRVADLSPSLMDDLNIQTDDEIEVIFPEQTTTNIKNL